MIDDWTGKDDLHLVGYVGISLYLTFFAVSIYRTFYILPHVDVKHPKFAFHCSFSASFFLEFFYFLGFAVEGRVSLWSFCFHIAGLICYLLGYSSVILLWAETLTFGGKPNPLPKYCIIFSIGIHGIAAMIEIGVLISSDGYDDFLDTYPIISIVFLVVHSTTFLLLTGGMLLYGIKLQINLNANTMWLQSENSKKLIILAKINILLLVCTICYALRVVTLALLFGDMALGNNSTSGIPELAWFVLSQFIPTLVPACLLLHFMRVKEPPRSSSCFVDTKGGGLIGESSSSRRPRQTAGDDEAEGEGEPRESETSQRDSQRSYSSDVSDDPGLTSPYKTKYPSDVNRISLMSANSDFFIETESPLLRDPAM